jgi:hypothetical protein
MARGRARREEAVKLKYDSFRSPRVATVVVQRLPQKETARM